MSVGMQFIRSVLDNGSRSAVSAVSDALFTAEEIPAWRFVLTHYQRYGNLPTADVMRENSYTLPIANAAFDYYADRLRERAVYRLFQEADPEIRRCLLSRDTARLREIAAQLNTDVGHFDAQDSVRSLAELSVIVMEQHREVQVSGTGMRGVTLGYPPLDSVTSGGQGGDVVSVVARPNIGKSWVLINMMFQAWRAGHSTLILSMEMTDVQITRRLMGLDAGINPDFVRRGRMSYHGERIMHSRIEQYASMPPMHIMSGNFKKSTSDIDKAIGEFMPDIVYVDASYLLSSQKASRKGGARWERIYDVGEEVKAVAQDRDRCIVQSLQLGRNHKKGDEMDLDQIAGGDVVGQISSVVVGLDKGPPPDEDSTRTHAVIKNRDGTLTKYVTNFLFSPLNHRWEPEGGADATTDDDVRNVI
jgi:replicative DNA helicase